MRTTFLAVAGALLPLSFGLAQAADNDARSDAEREAAAQAHAAAQACFDRTEERRLVCVSAAMSDAAKQACYRTQETEVKASCSVGSAR